MTDEERRKKKREYARQYRANVAGYREKNIEYQREYRAANRAQLRAKRQQYALAHPDKLRARRRKWRAANPEKCRKNRVQWTANNPAKVLESYRKYAATHREIRRRIWWIYDKRRSGATPIWADLERLREIKAHCPAGYEIDHIVPLNGITPDGDPIRGLHVPWNLRYLRVVENRRRSNRMTEADLSARGL